MTQCQEFQWTLWIVIVCVNSQLIGYAMESVSICWLLATGWNGNESVARTAFLLVRFVGDGSTTLVPESNGVARAASLGVGKIAVVTAARFARAARSRSAVTAHLKRVIYQCCSAADAEISEGTIRYTRTANAASGLSTLRFNYKDKFIFETTFSGVVIAE